MHKYIEYISDLLFLHDCVVIPGFGGFICSYRSAYIDENSGIVCPPAKDILFNRNLIHNDGLLVNWIASKENITYDKASSLLDFFCEDLKIKLNQKNRVPFGEIGVFSTDRRFNIIFEPIKTNFFAETLGLKVINIRKLEVLNKPQAITAASYITPEIPNYINTWFSANIFQRLFKYALGVVAIAGVLVVSQLDVFDGINISRKITNITTVQPNFSTKSSLSDVVMFHNVISPNHDYVDYDPINDLNW